MEGIKARLVENERIWIALKLCWEWVMVKKCKDEHIWKVLVVSVKETIEMGWWYSHSDNFIKNKQ